MRKFRAYDKKNKKFLPNKCILNLKINYQYSNIVLQQYTGLKDKNDKKIFEGDILSVPDFPNMEVEYSDDRAGYIGTWPNNKTPRRYPVEDLDCDFVYGAEIIGNIFQNPNLLK